MVLFFEPELRKRNSHFERPTIGRYLPFRLPYSIPGIVRPIIVITNSVEQRTAGGNNKKEPVSFAARRIDRNAELIGSDIVVPP